MCVLVCAVVETQCGATILKPAAQPLSNSSTPHRNIIEQRYNDSCASRSCVCDSSHGAFVCVPVYLCTCTALTRRSHHDGSFTSNLVQRKITSISRGVTAAVHHNCCIYTIVNKRSRKLCVLPFELETTQQLPNFKSQHIPKETPCTSYDIIAACPDTSKVTATWDLVRLGIYSYSSVSVCTFTEYRGTWYLQVSIPGTHFVCIL